MVDGKGVILHCRCLGQSTRSLHKISSDQKWIKNRMIEVTDNWKRLGSGTFVPDSNYRTYFSSRCCRDSCVTQMEVYSANKTRRMVTSLFRWTALKRAIQSALAFRAPLPRVRSGSPSDGGWDGCAVSSRRLQAPLRHRYPINMSLHPLALIRSSAKSAQTLLPRSTGAFGIATSVTSYSEPCSDQHRGQFKRILELLLIINQLTRFFFIHPRTPSLKEKFIQPTDPQRNVWTRASSRAGPGVQHIADRRDRPEDHQIRIECIQNRNIWWQDQRTRGNPQGVVTNHRRNPPAHHRLPWRTTAPRVSQ